MAVVDLNSVSKEDAARMALAMYADEPCRICGENIDYEDLDGLKFAGYSEGCVSRAAHADCWDNRPPKKDWAYPLDAKDD